MVPKLVAEDIPLLQSLLSDVFPGVKYIGAEMKKLKAEIKKVCTEVNLVYGEGEEQGSAWVEKVRIWYCAGLDDLLSLRRSYGILLLIIFLLL